MVNKQKAFLVILLVLLIYPNDNIGGAYQPEFTAPIENVNVTLGRDATFTCLVKHLGGYRVGWVKADTKAIQAIHEQVITQNPRVSVSRGDHSTWNLHIKGVQLEDGGLYMCQINTDPMKSQTGVLSIVVPPDFVPEETSSDVMVSEGGQVKLTCRATGVPPPKILWRREDGQYIVIRENVGNSVNQKAPVTKVEDYKGEELKLTKVTRNDMGVYMCIASNGVPPSISKRITVNVHFPPVIQVPNQLVGAPLGTDVNLECFVEASPKSINYWVKDKGSMIISSIRHDVQTVAKSQFEVKMILTIRKLQEEDVGTYSCAAKNSLGEVESSIRLYNYQKPHQPVWPFYDEEDDAVYGSADTEKSENKQLPLDNTVQGQVGGFAPVGTASSTIKMNKKRPFVSIASSSTTFHIQAYHNFIISMTFVAFIIIRRRC